MYKRFLDIIKRKIMVTHMILYKQKKKNIWLCYFMKEEKNEKLMLGTENDDRRDGKKIIFVVAYNH